MLRIRLSKAVCADLLTGFNPITYVMRYNHFPHEVLSADVFDNGRAVQQAVAFVLGWG